MTGSSNRSHSHPTVTIWRSRPGTATGIRVSSSSGLTAAIGGTSAGLPTPTGRRTASSDLATGHGCVVVAEPFEDARGSRIRGKCRVPRWSPDGGKLVFETSGGCAVVTATPETGWAVRLRQVVQGGGGRVLLGPRCASPGWSPDGRWIAFETDRGLWVSRSNGGDSRRLGPAHDVTDLPYAWSPDSTRIAMGNLVLALDGETTRLRFGSEESAPVWLAGGGRLVVAGRAHEDPAQLWSVRADGTGLRRLTSAGVNEPVGLARPAPARPPAGKPPWSERVLGPTAVETRGPIGLLSADGGRVAYIPGTTGADCQHVSIWTPADGSIERVWQRLPAPCQDDVIGDGDSLFELALARSFIGWSEVYLCGNSGCGSELTIAALPDASPVAAADDDGTDYGNESHAYFGPVGHGSVFASSWVGIRVALPNGKIRRCKPGDDDYVSVDDRRIAAYRGAKIVVLDDTCAVVRAFHLGDVQRVLLDGDRLVVARSGQLEAYDVRTGAQELQRPLQPGYSLADVSRGIALLQHRGTIMLLRLADGRTYTLQPGRGRVLGEIEAPGLYYSYATPQGGGRLVFVPRSDSNGDSDEALLEPARCLACRARGERLRLAAAAAGSRVRGARASSRSGPGGGGHPRYASRAVSDRASLRRWLFPRGTGCRARRPQWRRRAGPRRRQPGRRQRRRLGAPESRGRQLRRAARLRHRKRCECRRPGRPRLRRHAGPRDGQRRHKHRLRTPQSRQRTIRAPGRISCLEHALGGGRRRSRRRQVSGSRGREPERQA